MDSLLIDVNENQTRLEEETDEEIFNRAHAIFASPEKADSLPFDDLQENAVSAGITPINVPTNSTPQCSPNHTKEFDGSFGISPITFDNDPLKRKKGKIRSFNRDTRNLAFENSFLTSSRSCNVNVCQNFPNSMKYHRKRSTSDDDISRSPGTKKRRRCKVQCVIINPPTQNFTQSAVKDMINVPSVSADLHIDEKCTPTSSSTKAIEEAILFHKSSVMSKMKICHKTATEVSRINSLVAVKELENEIEDVNSLKDSQDPEVIETFDTQAPIYIEPDIIADLMKSDDSIYDELSDDEKKPISKQSSVVVQDVKESKMITTDSMNPSKKNPQTEKADSQDSSNDLFAEQVGHSPVIGNTNDWPKLSDMSSQEISKHFEFRLSESDDDSSYKSCDSDDLFP